MNLSLNLGLNLRPPARLGVLVAAATLLLDQANKLWLMFVFDIEARQPVRLAPFFDVVFARNTGVSYSLFSGGGAGARVILLLVALAATAFLLALLAHAKSRLVGAALGLIIGGALGNAVDRAAYGFVADFYFFHVGDFRWYVFNLADVAIVVGVALLLLDALRGDRTEKTSRERGAQAP